jgi:hypothetical protein
MIDWSRVKSVTIPDGSVKQIDIDGTTVWTKQEGILPSEYQQVEWIGTSGTQYLNIPYTMVQDDEYDIIAMVTSWSGYEAPVSCGNGTYQFIILLQSGTSFYKYFAHGDASRFNSPGNAKARYTNKGHVGKLVVSNADTGVEISNCYSSYQRDIDGADKSLYVLKRANNTSPFRGRLYSLTITNGDTEKLNLVPCVRKADSVAGVFDTVSKTFYTNAGMGTFSVPEQ